MSRPLTPATRAAINAAETNEVFLVLLTIDHPSLPDPLRVSSDSVNTTSRGMVFVSYPFDLTLPDDEDGRPPRARLVIDNVDRTIVATVRGLESSPRVKIEIIRAAEPDVIEAVFEDFRFTGIAYDSLTVSGDLTIEDFTAEPYPAGSFSPGYFPGLF